VSRRVFLFLAALGLPAVSPSASQISDNPSSAPAANWEMKVFTKEGFRSMILRGGEVRVAAANRYEVVDFNVTMFSGKADAQVESILLSPAATFFARENQASGEKSVRLIRDDVEITGEQWTYSHAQEKVTIQKNTRVVFHAALPDLIR
jgi:hypothetical protein